jgi:hypothetical protein
MANIYCGNNSLSKELTSKKKRGSRFECFRKGVGIGLAQPLDKSYLSKYKAIDKRKMYCGKARSLPDGYSIMGSSSMCLQHGVGIGKKMKAKRSKSRRKSKVKRKQSRKSKVKRKQSRKRSKSRRKRSKSRRKSKVKRKQSRKRSKSRRKSKVKRKQSRKRSKSRRKSIRKMSAMRDPIGNHECLDGSLRPYLEKLESKYEIHCWPPPGQIGGNTSVQITIKDPNSDTPYIAKLQGVVHVSDKTSSIGWIEVSGEYTGKNFAKYLILLFAKFVSINNIPTIKLDDVRKDRLSNPRNIYESLGFTYDMENDPYATGMTANVDDILDQENEILANFSAKLRLLYEPPAKRPRR